MPKLVEDQVIVDVGPFRVVLDLVQRNWYIYFQLTQDEQLTVAYGDDEYGMDVKVLEFINRLVKSCDDRPGVCSAPVSVRTSPVK